MCEKRMNFCKFRKSRIIVRKKEYIDKSEMTFYNEYIGFTKKNYRLKSEL